MMQAICLHISRLICSVVSPPGLARSFSRSCRESAAAPLSQPLDHLGPGRHDGLMAVRCYIEEYTAAGGGMGVRLREKEPGTHLIAAQYTQIRRHPGVLGGAGSPAGRCLRSVSCAAAGRS